jgi:hypothetical protein
MWLEHPLFYALEVARSLDDAAEMFIRQVQKMHNKASDALVIYWAAHAERTDALVARLREIALAHKAEGTREQRLAAVEMLLAPSLATTTYPSYRVSTAADVVPFVSS